MTLLGSTIAKLLILEARISQMVWKVSFVLCVCCLSTVHTSHMYICLCYSHMFRLNVNIVHLKLCFVLAFKVKLQSILFPYVFSHLLYPWQSFLSPMCSFLMWRLWPSLLSFLYWQMWHLNETPWCTAICFFDKYFFPAYPHCCNHSWCNHIWALHEHFSHAFSCEIDTLLCNHIDDDSNQRNSHLQQYTGQDPLSFLLQPGL